MALVGLGTVGSLLALFFPWIGVTNDLGIDARASGFSSGGLSYLVVGVLLTTFFLVRNLSPRATRPLPFADWIIYLAAGLYLLLTVLSIWDTRVVSDVRYSLEYGWWVALISAALVLLGGLGVGAASPTLEG